MNSSQPSIRTNPRISHLSLLLLIFLCLEKLVKDTRLLSGSQDSVYPTEWSPAVCEKQVVYLPAAAQDVSKSDGENNSNSTGAQTQQQSASASFWAIEKKHECFEYMDYFHTLNECSRSYGESPCKYQRSLPLYNWAFYGGQGFGRLLEHTVKHCIVATKLHRPCVVDMEPMDPHYTFRTFLQPGTYNWEPNIYKRNESIRNELDSATRLLPSKADNAWESIALPPYSFIRPLQPLDTRMYEINGGNPGLTYVDLWDGLQGNDKGKILLSPNWGKAWFTRIPWVVDDDDCDTEKIRTLMQNAMYTPTDLLKRLFLERKKEVIGEGEFGTIHFRTYFSKSDTESMIQNVRECISMNPKITKWWIISDDPGFAQNASEALPNLSHGYNASIATAHSRDAIMREKYLHQLLEETMLDWMALHESREAIVSNGAFGETGARGNGKVLSAVCSGSEMHVFRRYDEQ